MREGDLKILTPAHRKADMLACKGVAIFRGVTAGQR